MIPSKRFKKKVQKPRVQKPRVSKHLHLWPELEHMPPLAHWPNHDQIYRTDDSEVLRFLVEGFQVTFDEAKKIFDGARKNGTIRFCKHSGLWCGRKGGRP